MRIIDEDVDIPLESVVEKKFDFEIIEIAEPEENPVIVLSGTRADELKMIGKFQTSNWKDLEEKKTTSQDSRVRTRHDSESSDEALQHVSSKKRNRNDERRERHDSDSDDQCSSKDLSPPRKRKTSEKKNGDLSPARNNRRQSRKSDSDSDSQVRRRPIKREPEEDLSPVRKTDTHMSPPRHRKTIKKEIDSDSSPPRRNEKEKIYSDSSPPRKHRRDYSPSSSSRSGGKKEAESKNKVKLTISGAKAGLRNAKDLRNELKELRKREDEMFKKHGDKATGRNADTIVRKKMVASSKQKKEPTEEEKQRKAELEEKYKVWNKGVKQVKDREEKLKEMAETIDKPLARYADDKDLEVHLKDQMLSEDPMLKYMMEKRVKEGKHITSAQAYKGPPPPPNRYQILPGSRWDGCDRSNGFEKTLLSQGNLKKAEEEEYYQWSSGRFE